MKNIITTTALLLFCFVSCENKIENKTRGNLNLDLPTNRVELNSYIDSVEFIHLKEKEDYLLGRITKIDIINDTIYFLDKPNSRSNSTSIYMYDIQGNPIKKLNNVGNGPNEYLEIADFDIDIKRREINLLCFPPKLITLDMNLNIIKEEQTFEKGYTQIVSTNDSIFLYSYYSSCLDNITAKGNNSVMTFDEPSSGIVYTPSSGDFSFFRIDNDIYFQPYLQDKLYLFSNQGLNLFKDIYYTGKEEAMNFYKKHI